MANIALVVLDTLRKDAFDRHFDWLPGWRFENAWSIGRYTVPAHAGLFTGKYASEVGTHSKNERLDTPDEVLAERLSNAGYHTHALCENVLLGGSPGFDRGFQKFKNIGRAIQLERGIFNWENHIQDIPSNGFVRNVRAVSECIRSDNQTIPSLQVGWKMVNRNFHGVEELKKQPPIINPGGDSFLFINLMEAHQPCLPPKEYRTGEYTNTTEGADNEHIFNPRSDLTKQKQAYDDSARYLSDKYEEVFEDLLENYDYIFTLADHGELFGEHGVIRHGFGIFPELTHIPLVLSSKTLENRKINKVVNLLDIHRTILSIAGISRLPECRGRNLCEPFENTPVLCETHGLRPNQKKILKKYNLSDEEIENCDVKLSGIAAPRDYYGYEMPDKYEEIGTSAIETPHQHLKKLVNSLSIRDIDPSETVNEDIKSQLEYLGYA